MCDAFNKLPEMAQGLIYTVCGAILLLYALGFIQRGINMIVIISAIYLICLGFVKSGLYKKTMKAIEKK